ncbi:hypothetical protein [Helicobacter pylori]|uniref:hypothetical protein n=1 Tax=Helicobacter pylori TaxID=210 RepID=UPI0011592AB9|nr:hypothetical protein [Helicobacter pylori]QDK11830.1 hypothetical protein D8X81_07525 [Helicobacter pylori]
MKQKVHSVSYLARAEFALKTGVYDLVALPTGAEVVKVSLEVVGDPKSGSVTVGFKDEKTEKHYFLKLESVTGENKNATSAKDYTATSDKVVVAEVKTANETEAKGVLRVLYFLPSVIEVEY